MVAAGNIGRRVKTTRSKEVVTSSKDKGTCNQGRRKEDNRRETTTKRNNECATRDIVVDQSGKNKKRKRGKKKLKQQTQLKQVLSGDDDDGSSGNENESDEEDVVETGTEAIDSAKWVDNSKSKMNSYTPVTNEKNERESENNEDLNNEEEDEEDNSEEISDAVDNSQITKKTLFGEKTSFSRAQEASSAYQLEGIRSEDSDESSAEMKRLRNLVKELEKERINRSLSGEAVVKRKLDAAQEIALGAAWASRVFQNVKYANSKVLDYENPNGLLKKAYKCIGIDTEGQRRAHCDAVKVYVKARIGRMRDYFVSKVRELVLNIGMCW
jgi:hypothetical protein